MEPSATAYDDSFRTLLNDCRELIIPVVNEAFGENYTGREEVIFVPNELFLNQDGGIEEKRITDSNFIIVRADGAKKRYHIECEANLDADIILRIFEYDAQIALNDSKREGAILTVSFPHSAVMALRHRANTPDTMRIRVVTPGGEARYNVPVIKVQQYGLEEIFRRRLLFFLPFYIFSHEKQLPEYESDEAKLRTLTDEYRHIRAKLDELQEAGSLNAFIKNAICAMTAHVLALIAENYQKVREGVEHIMKGKIVDYDAKDILRQGIAQGRIEGRIEGRDEGRMEGRKEGRIEGRNEGRKEGRIEERQLALAETEERAKDMLRDHMELPLVEKYTHLSISRIQELARGLGML